MQFLHGQTAGLRVFAAMQRIISAMSEKWRKAMAYPVEKPETPIPALPDWVEVYYTPEAAANRPEAPTLSVLEQMYAYYDG